MPLDIDARIAEWRKSLLDTTKRNRLIRFVTGRVGGVKLIYPSAIDLWASLVRDGQTCTFVWKHDLLGLPPEVINSNTFASDFDPNRVSSDPAPDEIARELTQACLRSPHLRRSHILTDFTDSQLTARLTHMARSACEAATDHGITTLFAAFGLLRWYEQKNSTEELLSPLLLIPIRLARTTVESEYTVSAEDDIFPNHCLAELLQAQFRIKLPSQSEYTLDPEKAECFSGYLAAVRQKVEHVPRWEVLESAAIGLFSFQKLAMWEDLGRNGERLKSHPLCRAIAGDVEVALAAPRDLLAASDLDRIVAPETTSHILDADSSQHEAIEAVKHGAHLVMDGPPGTGKSQTIANIIAEALAAGRTVLFVSEKAAALEVVKRRLDKAGLGDFCLELHSHKTSKKEVVAELGKCLEIPPLGAPDISTQLRQLTQDRQKLNEFVAELHAIRHPFGWSAFRAHGELAQLDRGSARSRIAIKDVALRDAEFVRQGSEILAGLTDCASVIEEPGGHPWKGCKITTFTHTALDDAEYQVGRLSDVIPPAEKAVVALAALGFAGEPSTVNEWHSGEDDARRLLAAPVFPASWLEGDARATAAALVSMNDATCRARELSAQLPEFDREGLRKCTDAASVIELIPDRERLTEANALTARARAAALVRIESILRRLANTAAELNTVSRNVVGFLQITRTPTADNFSYLAEVAHQVADGPPIPIEWWDASRREEILHACARGEDEEKVVVAERARLLERFVPDALDAESLMFVLEAARQSKSLWLRLWPRWWRTKKHILGWYLSTQPSGTKLCADILELERYHRQAMGVRQIAAEYTGDFITGQGGKPEWSASAERIHAIGWLEAVGVQHTFKAVAGPRRTLNRTALGDAARVLSRLSRSLEDEWNQLLTEFAVPDAKTQLTRSASELAAWFSEEAKAVHREAEALAVMIATLSADKDVLPTEMRNRAICFRDLVTARSQIAAAGKVLSDSRPLDVIEAADHSANAIMAKQLHDILEGLKRPVTPAVAAAFRDPAVREKLSATLRQSEAARRPFDKSWSRVTTDLFDPDVEVSTNVVLSKLALPDLRIWAAARAKDASRLAEWTRLAKVEQDAVSFGVSAVLEEVKAREIPAAEAADAFRARFFRLWLDTVHQQVPALASFATDTHDRLIARFAELDRLAIRTTPDRVRSKLLMNPNRPIARESPPEGSELGILLREVNKKRRHLPLRRLFAEIPSILPRLKPCMMMSPLAVSTYLDTSEISFDLVIFDEASQVRPHDAVCAIYRGRQLVVGGDPRQLPPSDFFTRSGAEWPEDETHESEATAFESLLDVCLSLGLTRKKLKWHYRSRREALIAFSNTHFYEGRLVTFPSAEEATARAISLVKVLDGRFSNGVNETEARRVAELVIEHARNTPRRSLGVIAFSIRQQERILDELEVLRRRTPETEEFFSGERDDPFFVKNLENVQGDERDVILLSVGYGPDETGRVAMRFGPLNHAGGERRLNVAITRARYSMVVVSSITSADIDLARTGAEGAKFLKRFLDYAERGPVGVVGDLAFDHGENRFAV